MKQRIREDKKGYCAYEKHKKREREKNDEKKNEKLHLYNDYHYDYCLLLLRFTIVSHPSLVIIARKKKKKKYDKRKRQKL